MERSYQLAMQIILYSSKVQTHCQQSLAHAQNNNKLEADKSLKKANDELSKAHNIQTKLLEKEAKGEATDLYLILVHAQDHLTSSQNWLQLTKYLNDVFYRLNVLEEE